LGKGRSKKNDMDVLSVTVYQLKVFNGEAGKGGEIRKKWEDSGVSDFLSQRWRGQANLGLTNTYGGRWKGVL